MKPAQNAAHAGWNGIVDVTSLRSALGTPTLRILDCRHDLAQPDLGQQQYRQGHIPGAVFAHLERDMADARISDGGRHPLPDRAELAARLRSWGISTTSQVVAYDASEGSYAARAWWLLRWLGHPSVAVLDGGWPAWVAAGCPWSAQEPDREPGDFTARPSLQPVVDVDAVAARSATAAPGSPSLLLDARAPDRYEGRNETVDPVAGHIPGAVNRFWKLNLAAGGRFKAPAQLRSEYEAILGGRAPDQVSVQCGSGVTACHDLLAMHLAGLEGAALFPGSWSQWIRDPARPIRTGPAP
jgi:thiosulfate/3-mercaptopyruvate sulfurtransferase